MKKQTKIIIAVVAIILVVSAVVAFVVLSKDNAEEKKSKLPQVNSAEELSALIDKVYEGQENLLPSLNTTIVDVKEKDMVNMVTGLENGDDLEFLAVSEPMMSSQAYSFVLAKVKDGVNSNDVAKEMSEKVNPAKWICVRAEKVYATSSEDIVCLVMSSEEWGKPIYDSFKKVAGNVDKEYEETTVEEDLGEGMFTAF